MLVVSVQPKLLCIDPRVGFEAVVKTAVPASAIVRAYEIDSGMHWWSDTAKSNGLVRVR